MRILFSSLHSPGHTYPLIPLARGAREVGHEVLFATGDEFHPTLRACGLEPVAAGMPMSDGFVAAYGGPFNPQELPPEQVRELLPRAFGAEMPRKFIADLAGVFEQSTVELVVHEAGNHGAGIAAIGAGIPGLCHGFGRAPTADLPAFDPALRGCAAEFGIELPAGDLRNMGRPYLDVCPLSLQVPEFVARVERIPIRPVPFADSGELPDRVTKRDGTRALVYLTLGTAFGTVEVLRDAIEGLGTLEADVLVASGPSVRLEELGEVPDNVSLHSWLPQADLLAHVDLVVQHGGSGTTLGALAAGVPQLFLPQGADQFDNAEVVTSVGAGETLSVAEINAGTVATTAKALLAQPSYRNRAGTLAEEIAAMPTPAQVAGQLADLAG